MLSFKKSGQWSLFWRSAVFLLMPPGQRGCKPSSLLSKSPSVPSPTHLLLFRSVHTLYVKWLNWLTVGLIQVQSCLTVFSLDFPAASYTARDKSLWDHFLLPSSTVTQGGLTNNFSSLFQNHNYCTVLMIH